ncbi:MULTISPECIES: ElyC/SanA/YdcF family protein [Cycloclasticus]|jgi:hypothetical protein|uniref:ElyC/SanA/YdcF family protein n=1 Tax=Cycloclasticus TaxID=34067 RepID=UPI000913C67F|nr:MULTISPECIES: ElyC/SanA/YdcF family protein [Cycloclasticus]PHR49459.1 MAG: hypothetical protein COA48_07760 [Cycloclasticus sp.]SHJ63053.1 DUF218 domain-containing protein [Cycloclasticus pugetii]|tara:strand:+ start:12041 stop:12736 length:696 start_codon:yes stop_codon:yes gene_type:complete
MTKFSLFKQHNIWLPSWWVVLLLFLVSSFVVFFCLKNLAFYLATTTPKHGHYLVIEGWINNASLDQGLNIFRNSSNEYQYIIVTGGPDIRDGSNPPKTYAELSAKYLLSKGVSKQKIIVISSPASAQARTYLSAVMVRDWFIDENINNPNIDVFTESVHARRTRFLYNLAFRASNDIGVHASTPSSYSLSTWWKSSEGVKSVITELLGLIWATYIFDSAEYHSPEEKWGMI